ncbi:MAG TPA: hypothetical protein VI423_11335 [Paenisporosarcina sp.]|nr:hypothetical protein [Paenisporosarcina sp.]
MRFITKTSYDEYATDLDENLKKVARTPIIEKVARESKAIQSLITAANLLDEAGFEAQAEEITDLLEKISWEVPASDTAGLTPEKMVSNLKDKGWVFNVEDGEILDVAEPDPDEHVSLEPDGEIEVVTSE